jgi:hypothetical protein
MTPVNMEDKEEYELSKYLLEKFIRSQTVLDVVGEHRFLVYKVIKFLRSHIYTRETLYLHNMRSLCYHHQNLRGEGDKDGGLPKADGQIPNQTPPWPSN